MNEKQIRGYIRRILVEAEKDKSNEKEQSDEPAPAPKKKKKRSRKKVASGEIATSLGGGAWSRAVGEAGALAEKDPEQLMKNLNISGGGSGLDGVGKILNSAFSGASAMGKAYGGLSVVTKGDMEGLLVSMGELDARNGAKYIQHTLIGAQNAGMFSLNEPLQIHKLDSGEVVIYVSDRKGSWSDA